MAIIKDIYERNLEIRFLPESGGYIRYGFKFFSDTGSFFNPALVSDEYFECYEYGEDTLIPILENTLNFEEPYTWNSLEPDIEINTNNDNGSIDIAISLNVAEFAPISKQVYGEFGIEVSFFVKKETLLQFIEDLKKEIKEMGK